MGHVEAITTVDMVLFWASLVTASFQTCAARASEPANMGLKAEPPATICTQISVRDFAPIEVYHLFNPQSAARTRLRSL
ncbi:MAG: hypothetical protein CME89_05310 [Hirschia sp.]|nr:hypothetical protein [Hirschia sp.]